MTTNVSLLAIRKLTVRDLRSVRRNGSIRNIATLLDGVVLGVTTPRDALFFEDINDSVGQGARDVEDIVGVQAKRSGRNVVKVVWLFNIQRH
jgi:hypothetical protein